MPAEPRQIISAMGLCNALGDDVEAVWRALRDGVPRTSAPPFALPFTTVCGLVQGPLEPLPAAQRAYDTRLTRIAQRVLPQVAAGVARARQRYGAERVGILLGTSTGGLDATEPAYRLFRSEQRHPADFTLRRQHAFDAAAMWLRDQLGLRGPCYAVSTACTSSAKAIASAGRLLRAGVCDAVLVVGVDAICETTLRGFHSLGVLSERAARPFSAERDGIHIGEGAAMLLLERAGQGEGPACVAAVGETSDAHSMSAPHPEGRGAVEAMQQALARAGLEPSSVDYVNAHGTGTEQNDRVESAAIRSIFPAHVAVSSTKGLTGHTLGACGAIEAIFAALAVLHGELPRNGGSESIDPALELNIVRERVRRPVKVALSNAFAFGGSNAAVVITAP